MEPGVANLPFGKQNGCNGSSKQIAPDLSVVLKRIQTSGDKIQDVPLAKVGGKGLFVKEIEEALLKNDIDLAVHSMKDMPAVLPSGLHIICVPEREDPRDALLAGDKKKFDALPLGARSGNEQFASTGSALTCPSRSSN